MENVIKKVESIIGVAKATGQCDMNATHRDDFISDLVQILPKIMAFFKQLAAHMKSIVHGGDGDGDSTAIEDCSQLFTDETNYIKICFGLCMRLLSGLYSWTAFENGDHQNILHGELAGGVESQAIIRSMNRDHS